MSVEKKPFSETRIYPIFFIIVISLFFGLILATFYHTTKDRVRKHSELRFKGALFSLFKLPLDNLEDVYDQYVEEVEKDELLYYKIREQEAVLGYSFHITGSGLWGSISALVAIDKDFDKLLGLYILEQNETPGLGGRIGEEKFQKQFSEKEIFSNEELVTYRLVGEDDSANEVEINQITGATLSSKAVVDMIHRELQVIFKKLDITGEKVR